MITGQRGEQMNKGEMGESWKYLHKEELRGFCCSPNIRTVK
jgi:hypothetical protein